MNNKNIKDTPTPALTALNCNTHTVAMTMNEDLTTSFWPHPALHDEILSEAGVDKSNPAQVEMALRNHANEMVECSAVALSAWKHIHPDGRETYYANSQINPVRNIRDPKRTHYVRPVVGGVPSDEGVTEAREFFNTGLPDLQAGTLTGKPFFRGGAMATTYSYTQAKAALPTKPKMPRKKASKK